MLGFLGGLAVSGPIAGYVVDEVGTYRPVWIGAAVVSAIAATLMAVTDRRGSPSGRHDDGRVAARH